jgi:predicted nucleic-acid-binding protein
MIGVDSNVLLRHFVRDDPQQTPVVARFFAARGPGDPAYVSIAVLLEVIWTLRRTYRLPQVDVARVVWTLTRSPEIVLQSHVAIRRALWDAEDQQGDIADAIIAHIAIDAGCDGVVTFDKQAQRLPGMLPVG